MFLSGVEYYKPTNIPDACDLLERFGEGASLLAGGTDLVLSIKRGEATPEVIIDLAGLPETGILEMRNGELHIGSMATFAALSSSAAIGRHAPALQAAVSDIGSPQIRNMGTIGGNIATASPAGDCLPALVAHEAHIVLAGRTGERRVELKEYLKGQRERPRVKEVITEVIIPVGAETVQGSFVKLGRRNSLAIARISAALVVRRAPAGGIKDAKLVLGALGRIPVVVAEAEALITADMLEWDVREQVAECAAEAVRRSIPGRPTMLYKARAVKGIVHELLERVIDG